MIPFSKFKESIPRIECGIDRTQMLNEEIHVSDYYNYLGPKETAPKKDYAIHGAISDPTPENDDSYIHYKNDGTSIRLRSLDSAEAFTNALKTKYQRGLKSAHVLLSNHYNQLDEPKKADAIRKYTSTNAIDINTRLIKGTPTKNDSAYIKNLDSALDTHRTPDDMVVYTGANKAHTKLLRNSDVVHHPGYLSTSLSISSARSFASKKGGDIIQLHVPKDHPGAYVSHIAKHEGEREFILPRNQKIKIDRSKEKVLKGPYGEYRVHHGTLVD